MPTISPPKPSRSDAPHPDQASMPRFLTSQGISPSTYAAFQDDVLPIKNVGLAFLTRVPGGKRVSSSGRVLPQAPDGGILVDKNGTHSLNGGKDLSMWIAHPRVADTGMPNSVPNDMVTDVRWVKSPLDAMAMFQVEPEFPNHQRMAFIATLRPPTAEQLAAAMEAYPRAEHTLAFGDTFTKEESASMTQAVLSPDTPVRITPAPGGGGWADFVKEQVRRSCAEEAQGICLYLASLSDGRDLASGDASYLGTPLRQMMERSASPGRMFNGEAAKKALLDRLDILNELYGRRLASEGVPPQYLPAAGKEEPLGIRR